MVQEAAHDDKTVAFLLTQSLRESPEEDAAKRREEEVRVKAKKANELVKQEDTGFFWMSGSSSSSKRKRKKERKKKAPKTASLPRSVSGRCLRSQFKEKVAALVVLLVSVLLTLCSLRLSAGPSCQASWLHSFSSFLQMST